MDRPGVTELDELFGAYPKEGWMVWTPEQRRGFVLAALHVFRARTRALEKGSLDWVADMVVEARNNAITDATLASNIRTAGRSLTSEELKAAGLSSRIKIGADFLALLTKSGIEQERDVATALATEARRRESNLLRYEIAVEEGENLVLMAQPDCCMLRLEGLKHIPGKPMTPRSRLKHLPAAYCDQVKCSCNWSRVPRTDLQLRMEERRAQRQAGGVAALAQTGQSNREPRAPQNSFQSCQSCLTTFTIVILVLWVIGQFTG